MPREKALCAYVLMSIKKGRMCLCAYVKRKSLMCLCAYVNKKTYVSRKEFVLLSKNYNFVLKN